MASLKFLIALLALALPLIDARHGDTCQLTYQSCRNLLFTDYTTCEISVLEAAANFIRVTCKPILLDREECRTDTRVSPSWYELLLNDVFQHLNTICERSTPTSTTFTPLPSVPSFCLSGFGTVLTPVGDCSSFDITVGNHPPANPQPSKTCQPPLKFDTRPGVCVCNHVDAHYQCSAVSSPSPTTTPQTVTVSTTTERVHDNLVQTVDGVHVLGSPARACYTGDVPVNVYTPTSDCRSFDQTLGPSVPSHPRALHNCRPNTKFDLRWCACNHESIVGPGCYSQP